MNIYLGSDHGGYHLKEKVFAYLSKRGYEVSDVGDKELDPHDDFPQFAQMAALKVIGDIEDNSKAILLCKGGQGMCIAANRFRGIRAIVAWNAEVAREGRDDNDSNILCLPATVLETGPDQIWKDIIDTWLNTPFAGADRYRRRNRQLDELA